MAVLLKRCLKTAQGPLDFDGNSGLPERLKMRRHPNAVSKRIILRSDAP